MEKGLKSSLKFLGIILFVVLFIEIVNAYTSFSLIKEDRDLKKAIIIDNIDALQVSDDYQTIIELTETEGDFADLIGYLRSSKITRIVYFKEDINPKIIELIEQESGVSFRKLMNNDIKIDYEWQEDEYSKQNPIIVGNTINEQKNEKNYLFFIVSSVLIVVVLAILLVFMPKKENKLKEKN